MTSEPDASTPAKKRARKTAASDPNATGQPAAERTVFFDRVLLISPEDPRRIDAVRAADSSDPPEAMRRLLADIDQSARVISKVFANSLAQRRLLFEELHMTADLGLRGARYSVADALTNLAEIQGHIEDAFAVARDYFWRRNGWFVIVGLGPLIVGAVLLWAAQHGLWQIPAPDAKGVFDIHVATAIALLWIPFGVAVGLFLEFAFSVDRDLTYAELQKLNPGRWRPGQRLANTVMAAYCFAAVMGIGAFQIGVLNILLNEFITTRPVLSIAVGFVTGFSFPYVRDLLYKFRPVQR